jgi:hypothetical protein
MDKPPHDCYVSVIKLLSLTHYKRLGPFIISCKLSILSEILLSVMLGSIKKTNPVYRVDLRHGRD